MNTKTIHKFITSLSTHDIFSKTINFISAQNVFNPPTSKIKLFSGTFHFICTKHKKYSVLSSVFVPKHKSILNFESTKFPHYLSSIAENVRIHKRNANFVSQNYQLLDKDRSGPTNNGLHMGN
jgi:hypothetical protein